MENGEVHTSSSLTFFVNGKKVVESNVNPEWTLLHYLRNKLNLCGTKLGCAEGGCGACTVMVSKYDRAKNQVIHLAVNACLAPVCSMHGLAVTTVEGIGSTKTKLHPVQERIAKAHGSQCGFCTPGIVMSMYTLLRNMPKPSMQDLEVAFQGNLCRCTGYRPIIEGYKTFTEDWEQMQQQPVMNGCAMGDKCCKLNGNACPPPDENEVLYQSSEFTPVDPSQEPIFPPELKIRDEFDRENLIFAGKDLTWYRPTTLYNLLDLKSKFPQAKIIVGNTEVGVEVKFKKMSYPIYIQPNLIHEMTSIHTSNDGVTLGASVTLQDTETELRRQMKTEPEHKTRIFSAIVEMLNWFAGKQIRNVAAIGGNIMTGSPISDLNPIFMASRAELTVQSLARGVRKIEMNSKFFTGYRRNVVQPDEVLISVRIPFTKENEYFFAYKQARRRDDDIAIVNAAFDVTFEKDTNKIEDIHLAFGGMAPTTVAASKTRQALIGKEWNSQMLEDAYAKLVEDLPLSPSAPGGMIQYRRSLTLSMFFRAFLKVSHKLQAKLPELTIVPKEQKSGMDGLHAKVPKSSQYFHVIPDTQERSDTVGRPIPHMSAFKQATGEAVYCDDIPGYSEELYMGLVLSSKAHANIVTLDASKALSMSGVVAFYSAKDVDEHQNRCGTIIKDEEVFVSKTVRAVGQVIGVVIAEDQLTAQKAVKAVKIEYEDLKPVIVSIEDAIKYKSFFNDEPRIYSYGDVEKAFKESDHVLEGECRIGGQEHFYLETNCVIAVPKGESDEMEILISCQNPTEIQHLVAHFLGIPQNRIVAKVKRMGGGFGGKESRPFSIALPAALAAQRLGKPIRCMLDRDEDIILTGGRNPFLMKYKVGFNSDGKLNATEVHLYCNAGYSLDLSAAVVERALTHFENSYHIPNIKAYGYVCKTNLQSNTAFRGFGGPQGMLVAENLIRDVAEFLNKDVVNVARLNLYKENDVTYYNQTLKHCTLQRCWDECLDMANFRYRETEIAEFNKSNRWKKRGISVIPTKFGVAFNIQFMNQGGALVLVYTDGSVLVTHGGTEMGQGLHTKMIQIASRVLEIPVDKIHISETATDKVPNTSPTAASVSSDLNGMAVLRACETIKNRLAPIKEKDPKGGWEKWVKAAYLDRVSLSAAGFYKTPDIGYDHATNSGQMFNYFTYGVACTEVEIDCLTGDHQVLRTDIVMDVGESLNPAIDVGQVEGGFMQGYGLYMIEEMVYGADGNVFTRGPGAYKLPGFGDIPVEFNVALLKGAPNPRAVYSSKAVGEPPLFLASSALFAAREAIKAARKDAGVKESFRLNAPATSAAIRMACVDKITAKFSDPDPSTYVPWNILP